MEDRPAPVTPSGVGPVDWGTVSSDGESNRSLTRDPTRPHGLRRLQILNDGGLCVYDRVWLWDLDASADRVASLIQAMQAFGREIDGGGMAVWNSVVFPLHECAVVVCVQRCVALCSRISSVLLQIWDLWLHNDQGTSALCFMMLATANGR